MIHDLRTSTSNIGHGSWCYKWKRSRSGRNQGARSSGRSGCNRGAAAEEDAIGEQHEKQGAAAEADANGDSS